MPLWIVQLSGGLLWVAIGCIVVIPTLLFGTAMVSVYKERKKKLAVAREDDPAELLAHLRGMTGCTCGGGGKLTLRTYYCQVHGEEMRQKYPTAESLEAAMKPVMGTQESEKKESPKKRQKEVTQHGRLVRALEGEAFDPGRVELLESLCPLEVSGQEVLEILGTFSFDEGRVEACRVLAGRVTTSRVEVSMALGEVFSFDEGRAAGRRELLGK